MNFEWKRSLGEETDMKPEDLTVFKTKRLRLFLNDKIVYTGTIHTANDDSLIFLDKYNNLILIRYDVIERIEVIQNE